MTGHVGDKKGLQRKQGRLVGWGERSLVQTGQKGGVPGVGEKSQGSGSSKRLGRMPAAEGRRPWETGTPSQEALSQVPETTLHATLMRLTQPRRVVRPKSSKSPSLLRERAMRDAGAGPGSPSRRPRWPPGLAGWSWCGERRQLVLRAEGGPAGSLSEGAATGKS